VVGFSSVHFTNFVAWEWDWDEERKKEGCAMELHGHGVWKLCIAFCLSGNNNLFHCKEGK